MNREDLLRDYLFRFLRSPDYVTDVNYYLPKFLTSDPAFTETQRVLSWEHERYRLKLIDFAKQFHPQTATWGLNVWEEEFGLATDTNADLELRRARVMAKLLGSSPMTVENTNKLVNLFTNDGKAYIEELPEDGVIKVVIPSEVANTDEMRKSLDEMLPAHLDYNFQRVIEIGGDDASINPDGSIEIIEKDDSVADVNDADSTDEIKSFFMHTEFPIVENILYNDLHKTPKYDGSVTSKVTDISTGSIQYNGAKAYNGIDSDTVRFGNSREWWFVSTGKSTFGKEFQHDGAIRYDGLRPQEIEYDSGIDELEKVTLSNSVEEDIVGVEKYDRASTYNGAVLASEIKLPDDSGGNLELKRFRLFDGAIRYNGGDLNYFDGSIKNDGRFNYRGNGVKAQIEIITDDIAGKIDTAKPVKGEPLTKNYFEVIDFVPKILHTYLATVSTEAIEENVSNISDDCNAITIAQSVRYDGVKTYDGGDLNYFDGVVKADGTFQFKSHGNQAKTEIIGVDSDGTFELPKRAKKTAPPFIYIENFDFIAKIHDGVLFTAKTDFRDNISLHDGNGSLTIRQRARFNGSVSYRGNFECITRRFDGGLNYNGVYRVGTKGDIQFNGVERYGGRKNSNFYEFVTDLDSDIQIIDVNQIPIATRNKLGFVIIGNNLNVDDNGKISLKAEILNGNSSLKEIQAGVLPMLFESRRT